jgi:hypothetical protein
MFMDKLILNLSDVADPVLVVRMIGAIVEALGATANGVYRVEVDPDSDEAIGTIRILNNQVEVQL